MFFSEETLEGKKEPESLIEFIQMLKEKKIPEKKYKRYVDNFLETQARKKGIPKNGVFELTPLCNFDCKMCYVHLNKNQMSGAQVMPFESWKKIADEAIAAGMTRTLLTGGECLTYPDFKKLYMYLIEKGIETSVYTNGLLVNEEWIRFFKTYLPSVVQITLYGNNEETYEKVTGKRVFKTVIEHIKALVEADIPLKIAVTPSSFLKGEALKETVALAHKLVSVVNVNSMLYTPREGTGREEQEIDVSEEEYVNIFKYKANLEGRTLKPIPYEELPPVTQKSKEFVELKCGAGRSSFHIDWKGNMHPCGDILEIEEKPLETGFNFAWNKINEEIKKYPGVSECETCNYKGKCVICPKLHQINGEVGHADPKICKRTLKFAEAGLIFWE